MGVDLLVTHPTKRRQVSLQVKYSKDFKVTNAASALPTVRACGWWSLTREKIAQSPADYWVLVLYGFARGSIDFVVIRPRMLLQRLQKLHGSQDRYQMYLWTTDAGRCWETRGLKKDDQQQIADSNFRSAKRDFTRFLGDWSCLHDLGKRTGGAG